MKKKRILGTAITLMIIAVIAGGVVFMFKSAELREQQEEQQKQQERALKDAYYNQNQAFILYMDAKYHPPKREINDPFFDVYFNLACYQKTTGNELTYAQIYDYLSQEYEDDGEIRIYTNGRHPEIKEYVEWYQENKDACDSYSSEMLKIILDYRESYGISTSDEILVYFRNTAVMDELIKKEADPDYVMDERIMWEGLPYGPYAEGNNASGKLRLQ